MEILSECSLYWDKSSGILKSLASEVEYARDKNVRSKGQKGNFPPNGIIT